MRKGTLYCVFGFIFLKKRNDCQAGVEHETGTYNNFHKEGRAVPNIFPPMRTQPRASRRSERIPLQAIAVNPNQMRAVFDPEAIDSLADSIRRYGLLSPLIVRRTDSGYELIAGERRLRALRQLNAASAEAIVITAADRDSALIALVENLQRVDLNFFEEAEGYLTVIRQYGLLQEELAKRIGRDPSTVANRLRLLKLGPAVRREILQHNLSERHARALLKLSSELMQLKAVQEIAEKGLNVAKSEALIAAMIAEKPAPPHQNIRLFLRSRKLFVNTVMETVKQLNSAGLNCVSRVEENADCIHIILTLEHASTPALEKQS